MHLLSGVGERIQEVRKEMKMNQEGFASKMGVSKRTQAAYEAETSSPNAAYLAELASADVDVLYILTGQRLQPTTLPPDESALLDNYRHLGEEQKASINAVSEAMASPYKVDNKTSDV